MTTNKANKVSKTTTAKTAAKPAVKPAAKPAVKTTAAPAKEEPKKEAVKPVVFFNTPICWFFLALIAFTLFGAIRGQLKKKTN